MKRRAVFFLLSAVTLLVADPAAALSGERPDPLDHIAADAPAIRAVTDLIDRMERDGAELLEIDRTFLGRLRLVWVIGGQVREVVISPNTGEIRRDLVLGVYEPDDFPGQGQGNGKGRGQNGNSDGSEKGKSGASNGGNGNSNGKSKSKGK